jgi:hypothetical protein
VTKSGFVSFRNVKDIDNVSRRIINKREKNLKMMVMLLDGETISGVVDKEGFESLS